MLPMTRMNRLGSGSTPADELGVRAHPLPSGVGSVRQEFLLIEDHVVSPDVIDGPRQFVGEDGQGLALVVFPHQPLVIGFRGGVLSQEPDGGLREGPLDVRVADLRPPRENLFRDRCECSAPNTY